MSFNLDDPLAGILSDGSDDSFFDDDILGKKKPAKKNITPIAEKRNALFDLGDGDKSKTNLVDDNKKDSLFDFGLIESKIVSAVDDNDKTSKVDTTKSPGSFKRTLSKESIKISTEHKSNPVLDKLEFKSPAKSKLTASADKIDILGELTTESRKETVKPLEKRKSSQSLLDDILGGSSTKTGGSSQVTRPATAVKSQDFDFDTILGKSDSKQTLASNKNVPQKNIKIENLKDPPTTKKSSEDWLGIFGNTDAANEKEDNTGMPSWLVADTKKKKTASNEKKSSKPPPTENETTEDPKANQNTERAEKEKEYVININSNVEQLTKVPSSMLQNSNDDITAEGAALYIQQQESQLMVALQLKAQEEKLAAMQVRQKETQRVHREAAKAQHAQLDAMLRRQADQRQQMQAIISSHQERITQRIKDLLGTANLENEENISPHDTEYEGNPSERKESPHGREKKQLLQLVQTLQENHDKEIDLMETSYRRQLAFLEVSLNQSEERMKEESDKLVKFYTEKITWLEEHHHLHKKLAEENQASLSERHKAENEMLRLQHLENVRVLQEHHAALMENIKNAVKREHDLIQDSAGFSSDLHELVTDVKESKSTCLQLLEKVQALTENTQRDTERSIQARETQVNDMIQQLKNERANFESEKIESRDIVKMLETRLKQMTTMIEEETANLKQKKMEFEFEKATFSKQTEFAKNVLKKQDEEIKMLKEDIQKEYQEKVAKIDDEKAKALKDSAAVAREKVSIQSLKQELEKTKAELQAQLEEVTEERSKLNLEKQQMHMEEQRILAKSRDLDLLAKTAMEKQSHADKKYSEAEFIQRKYEDRIRRIQEHVVSLNSREKHIAREKVALSRERLMLHNERKNIESRQQCSLCKSTQNITPYNFEQNYILPETYLNVPVSRDYSGANVSSAMNAIEQEMAHLMGKNFSLRHTTGAVNVNNENRYMDDRTLGNNHLQASQSTQVETGAFKDYMDPKFMMLRLDVQQVLSNLDQTKREDVEDVDNEDNSV